MRFAIVATIITCALAAPLHVQDRPVASSPIAAHSTLLESLQRSLSAVSSPVNAISSIASAWLDAASDLSLSAGIDAIEEELPLATMSEAEVHIEESGCAQICGGWWFGELQGDETEVCTEEALERIGQCAQCLDSVRPPTPESRSAVARFTGLVLSCQAEYAS